MNRQPTDGICTCGFAHYHLGREPYGKYYELLYSEERRKATQTKCEIKNHGCISCGSKESTLILCGSPDFGFCCSECDGDYFKPAKSNPRKKDN